MLVSRVMLRAGGIIVCWHKVISGLVTQERIGSAMLIIPQSAGHYCIDGMQDYITRVEDVRMEDDTLCNRFKSLFAGTE